MIGYGGLVVLTPADGATVAVSRSVVDVSAMLLPYGNLRPTPPHALSATVRRIGSEIGSFRADDSPYVPR